MIQLLSTPEKFNGCWVHVEGFLVVADEEVRVYISSEAARYWQRENSIDVDWDPKHVPAHIEAADGLYHIALRGRFTVHRFKGDFVTNSLLLERAEVVDQPKARSFADPTPESSGTASSARAP